MESTRRLRRKPTDWLLASQFAPYVDAFTHHLTEGRYASHTIGNYLGCLAHFARWTTRCRLNICQIDEEADLAMKDKALARLQQPDTKMRRYRPRDALMQFLQAL